MKVLAKLLCLTCPVVWSCCPAPQANEGLNQCRDEVLALLFTQQARDIIESVPIREGDVNGSGGFAAGDDFGSQFISYLYGNGCGRQVLVRLGGASARDIGRGYVVRASLVFHEYIHQADYSGVISRDLFRRRFQRLLEDPGYNEGAAAVRDWVVQEWTRTPLDELAFSYDDGETRELIPSIIELWMYGTIDLPAYMLEVYEFALELENMLVWREQHRAFVEENFARAGVDPTDGRDGTIGRDPFYLFSDVHPIQYLVRCYVPKELTCNDATDICGECQVDAHCDDGIDCTDDSCIEGQCLAVPNNANCPGDAPFCVDENEDLLIIDERFECLGCCDPCLSQCDLELGICLDRTLDEYQDFSTTREQWLAEQSELGCDTSFSVLVAGECLNDPALFLSRSDGVTSLTHYFKHEEGEFISLTTGSDTIGPICLGVGYWPEHLMCENAVITEVVCGSHLDVGDTFDLR